MADQKGYRLTFVLTSFCIPIEDGCILGSALSGSGDAIRERTSYTCRARFRISGFHLHSLSVCNSGRLDISRGGEPCLRGMIIVFCIVVIDRTRKGKWPHKIDQQKQQNADIFMVLSVLHVKNAESEDRFTARELTRYLHLIHDFRWFQVDPFEPLQKRCCSNCSI